jgi:hypothetical protein
VPPASSIPEKHKLLFMNEVILAASHKGLCNSCLDVQGWRTRWLAYQTSTRLIDMLRRNFSGVRVVCVVGTLVMQAKFVSKYTSHELQRPKGCLHMGIRRNIAKQLIALPFH